MTPFTPSILSGAAVLRGAPSPVKRLVSRSSRAYKGLRMLTLFQPIAGTPRTGVSLERLEPCEGKLSRTVLGGGVGGLTACAYPVFLAPVWKRSPSRRLATEK
jgi:hypothetical protein